MFVLIPPPPLLCSRSPYYFQDPNEGKFPIKVEEPFLVCLMAEKAQSWRNGL